MNEDDLKRYREDLLMAALEKQPKGAIEVLIRQLQQLGQFELAQTVERILREKEEFDKTPH